MFDASGLRNAIESARDPYGLWKTSKANIQFWASLFVIVWAVAFMLWQGVGFAITVGTVFGIWAILAVSLNLVVGYTGLLSVGAHWLLWDRRVCHGDTDVGPGV